MKKIILFLTVILISTLYSQTNNTLSDQDQKNVLSCAENYLAGGHGGNVKQIQKSIHNEFNKVSVAALPNKRQLLRKAGYSRYLELVRANVVPLSEEERNLKTEILSACDNISCVKATSAQFYEYLQIVKTNDEWRLVNTLFKVQPSWIKAKNPERYVPYEDNEEKEKELIEECALNYIEGAFTGSAERMEKAIHPQMNKIIPQKLKKTGREMLNYSTYSALIEATGAGLLKLEKDKWDISYKLLDKFEDIAMVELVSSQYYDYLHLARINGEWKIVNVAWVPNPENK